MANNQRSPKAGYVNAGLQVTCDACTRKPGVGQDPLVGCEISGFPSVRALSASPQRFGSSIIHRRCSRQHAES